MYPTYNAATFTHYADAWQPTKLVSESLYTNPGYAALAHSFVLTATPITYDYGGNVVVQSDAVYVDGTNVGTPQQYAQQAMTIAAAGQTSEPAADSKWLALGVYAVMDGTATSSDDIFQLAINPDGIIRGNYQNLKTNQVESMSGSLDKSSQQVAWTIGGDQSPVYVAGLANLTQDSTPLLVLTSDGQSHQMTLIRLPAPTSSQAQTESAGVAAPE